MKDAPKTSIVHVPKLKSGDDAAIARELVARFDAAQNGMRAIVALGCFAWEIKEKQLKHGQWGPWLAEHAPSLCRKDSVTGAPKASSALTGYMTTTVSVLSSIGFDTIGKFLNAVAKFPSNGNLSHGQFLLLPDNEVPETVKPLREKIFALVDGKTQKQLFLEFKQAEEDGEGNVKTKRGRTKGSSGLTKEQRERAAARLEAARIEELAQNTKDTAQFLIENSDAKNFGMIDPKILRRLADAARTAIGFIDRLEDSRKSK
jgi:hypothetical protein